MRVQSTSFRKATSKDDFLFELIPTVNTHTHAHTHTHTYAHMHAHSHMYHIVDKGLRRDFLLFNHREQKKKYSVHYKIVTLKSNENRFHPLQLIIN